VLQKVAVSSCTYFSHIYVQKESSWN